MMSRIKCCICGNVYKGRYGDICPVCGWGNVGYEEKMYAEDEWDDYNLTTRKQSKEYFAKGLDRWGRPLQAQPNTRNK